MATLLSHGSQHPGQMHPFFRHMQAIKPPPSNSTESLETDTEKVPIEDAPVALMLEEASHKRVSLELAGRTGSPSAEPSIAASHVSATEAGVVAEIDQNSDQRKRRKITPSSHSGEGVPGVFNQCSEATEPWRQQLEEAANLIDPSTPPNHSNRISPAPQPSSTPSRSSRISIAKSVDTEVLTIPATARYTDVECPRVNARDGSRQISEDTPKKKMIKLSNKGKLVKSPSPKHQATRTRHALKPPVGQISLQHGRITTSRKVVINYNESNDQKMQVAEKINLILKGKLRIPSSSPAPEGSCAKTKDKPDPRKPPHPFFTGRSILRDQASSAPTTAGGRSTRDTSTEPPVTNVKAPVPWNEIKFNTTQSLRPKDLSTQHPLWPPLELQNPCSTTESSSLSRVPCTNTEPKQKRELVFVPEEEDVFKSYMSRLANNPGSMSNVQLPARLYLDDKEFLQLVEQHHRPELLSNQARIPLNRIKVRAFTSRSAFDQGKAAGPQDWTHAYSPQRAEEVLQPQSRGLYDWLSMLKVHQVQSKPSAGGDQGQKKRLSRRRKPKRDHDLDDFIASSDEEPARNSNSNNVILLCGPSGSAKSATVYAVAHELDFEVFEIHPGMRRTAKDIFDKVGDMARNHLVQPSAPPTRDCSSLTEGLEQEVVEEDPASGKQATMASFLGGRKETSGQRSTPQTEKIHLQRQSLILFEEVDILFDEDKSFWSGVQTLAQNSKRPIVLTCNSSESIPLDEINVHETLIFDLPLVADAVAYLAYVAAAEGHILDRQDLETLYLGRGRDLRASLMELNFWCQMTVGSELGGLDWMRYGNANQSKESRIVSSGTYHRGLDLLPEANMPEADLLAFAQDCFGLSQLDWEESQYQGTGETPFGHNRLKDLEEHLDLAETKSCMDLVDSTACSLLGTLSTSAFPKWRRRASRQDILDILSTRAAAPALSRQTLLDTLGPIMEDHRTFPPTTGRAASSLDGAALSVATEVAPYIRFIVAFDQQLEAVRDELTGGSQGAPQRKTRAARAALEGGNKASTRSERWFPKDLDLEAVLRTQPRRPYENSRYSTVEGCDAPDSSQATISDDGIRAGTPQRADAVFCVEKGISRIADE